MSASIVIGHRPNDHFTIVANSAARDARISLEARGLLLWLLSHAEGWEVSETTAAKLNGCGRTKIRSALAHLEEHGYVTREQNRAGGRFGGSKWVVTSEPTVVTIPDNGSPDVGETDARDSRDKEEHPQEDDSQEDQTPAPAFEEFWLAYPRKKGKKRARSLWSKLNAENRVAAIEGIGRYVASIEDPKYLKHGDTYLSHQPWIDDEEPEPEVPRPAPSPTPDCGDCGGSGWVDPEGAGVVRCACVEVAA